jgi:hypothetical protein
MILGIWRQIRLELKHPASIVVCTLELRKTLRHDLERLIVGEAVNQPCIGLAF